MSKLILNTLALDLARNCEFDQFSCEIHQIIAILQDIMPDVECYHNISATLRDGKLVCDGCSNYIDPDF